MNCTAAKRILYPNSNQAEITIAHLEALRHLDGCEACKEEIRCSEEWRDTLSERLPLEPAPARLRRSVAAMNERVSGGKARYLSLTRRALPGAIAACLAGFWWMHRERDAEFFRELCEDHSKYLAGQSEIESADPAAIEAWFQDQTDFAVHVPQFEQASLRGGRLCLLRGKRAALLFYQRRERPVSLFQFTTEEVNLRELERSIIDGAPIWRGSFQGFNVTAFEQRGMIYTLVSDLRESELLQLASAAQVQVRGR